MRATRPGPERPPTPGEVLRDWQRGACDWLQNAAKTAEYLQQSALQESAKAVQRLQRHHHYRHARVSRHAAFASLSGSLPVPHQSRSSADKLHFSGKGMNCIIGDLADSSTFSDPHKGQAAAGKPVGEEQERILVSEVRSAILRSWDQTKAIYVCLVAPCGALYILSEHLDMSAVQSTDPCNSVLRWDCRSR